MKSSVIANSTPLHTESAQKQVAKVLTTSRFSAALKEVALFGGIFVAVFIVSVVFVNVNVFYHAAKNIFSEVQAQEYVFTQNDATAQVNTIQQRKTLLESDGTKEKMNELTKNRTLFVSAKEKAEAGLQQTAHSFAYSVLPPGNRLFIPRIGVDAPIIDISAASEEKLRHGDFQNELYSGVVKYPSTPEPGMKGNALIFGHTSYYRWKKNPYGEIFAKIYDLEKGDAIQVARRGQLYTYKIVDIVITTPSHVDETYMQYTQGEYITLMGCYPIGSDTRRGLIIAQKQE